MFWYLIFALEATIQERWLHRQKLQVTTFLDLLLSVSESGTMIHLGSIKSCGSKTFEKDLMILNSRLIHLIFEFH